MINQHEANSTWWGRPVGILTDAAFFKQGLAEQQAALNSYAWVEFKSPLENAPSSDVLKQAGFSLADVQINFRIALHDVPPSASLEGYECHTAVKEPFCIGMNDVRTFEHERFLEIPGVTHEMLNRRYISWANQIINTYPDWCLRLSHSGQTQGWFLSQLTGSTVDLTLAMLAKGATVSGQHLYQCALSEYAHLGANIGHASFSIRNTPVLNIYARFGAKFTPPTGVWFWIRKG
jgi:hypothetical protein